MTKRIFIALILLFIIFTYTSRAEEDSKPSKDMEAIISQLKNGEWTLDVSGFNAIQCNNILKDPLEGNFEQHVFPPVSIKGQDMHHYVIKLDRTNRKFWIWRTRAFAKLSMSTWAKKSILNEQTKSNLTGLDLSG